MENRFRELPLAQRDWNHPPFWRDEWEHGRVHLDGSNWYGSREHMNEIFSNVDHDFDVNFDER